MEILSLPFFLKILFMIKRNIFFVLGLAAICSCNRADEISKVNERPVITATLDAGASKVVLVDEGYGDLQWKKGDRISVFDQDGVSSSGGYEFTAASSASTTEFVGPDGVTLTPRIYALYPYQEDAAFDLDTRAVIFTVPSSQQSVSSGFGNSVSSEFGIVLLGASDDADAVAFYNACSGIRFTVSNNNIKKVVLKGNNGEILAGPACASFHDDCSFSVIGSPEEGETSIELTTSDSFSTGRYYYISLIPGAFYRGFTLEFYSDSETLVASTRTDSYKKLAPGAFGTILNADLQSSVDRITDGEDISVNGPANCYIVSKSGSYKFPTCIGNSRKMPVVGGHTAEVLWSCNSTYKFDKDIIITSADLGDGYVYFKTPYVLENGNAVIAVRDADGEILWSWHIWVLDGYDPDDKAFHINGHAVMDRNLGAFGIFGNADKAHGLLYQWGRKDPFPGYLGNATRPELFTARAFDSAQTTAEYSVANPTVFVYGDSWCDEAKSDDLWDGAAKSVTDPCPAGWRIPSAGALKTSHSFSSSMYGVNLSDDDAKNCWFPMCGLLGDSDGVFKSYRKEAVIWTAGRKAVLANLDSRSINFEADAVPSTGGSVRCIKD